MKQILSILRAIGLDEQPSCYSNESLEEESPKAIKCPPKKRGRPPKQDNLDATVEEFSKAVEEEEQEQQSSSENPITLRSRRSRSITPKNLEFSSDVKPQVSDKIRYPYLL